MSMLVSAGKKRENTDTRALDIQALNQDLKKVRNNKTVY